MAEKRKFRTRLHILWLFVATTTYDKPDNPHRYGSLKWWRDAWRDTERLGS